MCNQTVGLIAAELERQGIATVAIQLLRKVAEEVRPPRALLVPFAHGYPLGRPGDPAGQRSVLEAMLSLLEDRALTPPALVEYRVCPRLFVMGSKARRGQGVPHR